MLKPVITKTSLGIYSVSYGLHINMLPRTEYERDVFNEVKEDFNKLISENLFTDAAGNSWAI
jgi:hypothetical protein